MYDIVLDELDDSHSHDDIRDNHFTPCIPSTLSHLYTACTGPGQTNSAATGSYMASTALVIRLKQAPAKAFINNGTPLYINRSRTICKPTFRTILSMSNRTCYFILYLSMHS